MLIVPAMAQHQDKVLGTWLTQYGDSKVTIKKDAKENFMARLLGLRNPIRMETQG